MSEREQQPTSLEEMSDRLKRPGTLELLCDAIIEGRMLREVALEWGVTIYRLRRWIAAEPARAAQVRAARVISAATYDEKAEQVIQDASDDLSLKKAKELAHHYRWKASKIDPGQYGEKIDVTANVNVREASDEQLARELAGMGLGAVAEALLKPSGGDRVH